MAIDLIPQSYHAYIRAKRVLRHAGIVAGAMLCAAAIAFASMQWRLNNVNKQLASLRPEAEQLTALRADIAAMQERKTELKTQVETLAMLQGKGEAAVAVKALDHALNDHVWLTRLRFHRVNTLADTSANGSGSAQNGLLRVEQNSAGVNGSSAADSRMTIRSQIELQGAAADHAMLAQFMGAIGQQPGIAKVRFLNSSASLREASSEVQFSVDAVIQDAQKHGD